MGTVWLKVGDIVRVKTHNNVKAKVTAVPNSLHAQGFHFFVTTIESSGMDWLPEGTTFGTDASKVEIIRRDYG